MKRAAHAMAIMLGAALSWGGLGDPASAQGSTKDAPGTEARKLEWTWNIGATTDYVFRGFSQSAGKPAFQAGADLTYGIFYAGFWGSHIDFGTYVDAIDGNRKQVGGFAEIDWYMGIKPVLGPVTFDLGVIYYSYPGAVDGNTVLTGKFYEWDYVELKAGGSMQPVKNLTTGLTLFYSPEYTNKQGSVWTLEGAVSYELPKIAGVTPTIGGLVGYQAGSFSATRFAALEPTYFAGNGDNDYLYWNVGLALAIDKLTLDFRYWDTNVSNDNAAIGTSDFCRGKAFQCDERFVFSAKLTF